MSDPEFHDHSSRDQEPEVGAAKTSAVDANEIRNGLLKDSKEGVVGDGEGERGAGRMSAPTANSNSSAPTTATSITYPSPLLAAILNFGLLLALFLVALDMVSLLGPIHDRPLVELY